MRDVIVDILTWLFVIFILLVIVGGTNLAVYKINELKCRSKATMQNMEYSFGLFQGCMVKEENGNWIDYNRLRYME